MGQAKRRGTFVERKQSAIIRDKEKQKQRDIEADKNYDSERPYQGASSMLALYMSLAGGLYPRIK